MFYEKNLHISSQAINLTGCAVILRKVIEDVVKFEKISDLSYFNLRISLYQIDIPK